MKIIFICVRVFVKFVMDYNSSLTRPMKNRTATSPERAASYCIQDLLSAMRRSKLFPVEKIPINITSLFLVTSGAFRCSTSTTKSLFSDTGNPLAKADKMSTPPVTLTPLTNHGSSFCTQRVNQMGCSLL